MLQVHFVRLHASWNRRGIVYSSQVHHEALVVGILVIGLAMIMAFFLPVLTSSRTHDAFWRRFGRTWGQVEAAMNRILVDRSPSGSLLGATRASSGVPDLPEHELGGPVTPGQDEVMHVWTDDIVDLEILDLEVDTLDLPKRYWRAWTYDQYTGRGWQSSRYGVGEIAPGEPLVAEKDPQKVYRVSQEFTVFRSDGLLFAVNEPLEVSEPVSVQYRSGWDLASGHVSADRYTVSSQVVKATVQELRNASTRYPEWAEGYLELPQRIPDRVEKLAQEVTRGAETPLDKALAIEAYLRTFEYSTEVPEVPAGQDVVDYFIFDMKKGYCDHLATAMVVMARSVGVPARYAVGYATGTLDFGLERYVVRDEDAHSWVEIYFPGYGWVEFEPSALRGRFDRWPGLGGGEALERQDLGGAGRTTNVQVDIEAIGRVVVGMAAVAALWTLWGLRGERIGGLPPRDFIRAAYERLCHHSERLGLGPKEWQTPMEYARLLSTSLETRAQLVPVLDRWPQWGEGELAQDVERLSDAYMQALYSPHPVSEGEKEILAESWQRLRRRMMFMRLRRKS
jgi:transglutaminase-like putative cysteine protease